MLGMSSSLCGGMQIASDPPLSINYFNHAPVPNYTIIIIIIIGHL